MKLNPDCVRDVLLYLEENLEIKNASEFSEITLKQIKESLSQYTEDDVFYSVYNLYKINYIEGKINDVGNKKFFFVKLTILHGVGINF